MGKKKSSSTNSKSRVRGKNTATALTKKKLSTPKNSTNPYDADESDPEECPDNYYQAPLQVRGD